MNSSREFTVEDKPTRDLLTFLCGEEFLNITSSWNSNSPDVGFCLERTILIWIPCIFLVVFSPLHLYLVMKKKSSKTPWTSLSKVKMVIGCFLILVAAVELICVITQPSQGIIVPPSEYLATILLLLIYIFHVYFVAIGHSHGELSSPFIWIFWLLMVISGVPQVFTTIQYVIIKDDRLYLPMAVTFLMQYCGAVTLFIVNSFAETPLNYKHASETNKLIPFYFASFPSILTFHWANSLVWHGYKNKIIQEDIWDIPPQMQANFLLRKWDEAWEKETTTRKQKDKSEKKKSSSTPHVSLLRVLIKRFFRMAIFASLIYLLSEVIVFANPRVLRALIRYTTDLSEPAWHGYFYALLLLFFTLVNTITKNLFYFMTLMLCSKIRSTLMAAVYKKALILSNASRRATTVGEIVNLMAIDVFRVGDAIIYINFSSVIPITLCIALVEIWKILGPSVLAGFAVLLLLIPANSMLADKIKSLQVEQMKHKDNRIKLVHEIISGIKVLKLYAWEGSFADQVNDIRKEEVKIMRKMVYIQALTSFLSNTMPYLVALVSFITYVLVSEENSLDAENAFVVVALANILYLPLAILPTSVAHCTQASVALTRLQKYLNSSNIDTNAVIQDEGIDSAVRISKGKFTWGSLEKEEPWHLMDINLTASHGSLIAVVGSVGTGKSSLVSALLGEMEKESGNVIMNGKVAYVSQQAWLQNASLKENIIWGEKEDIRKYKQVIEACALQPDLDILPGGDKTEVGEKGLNLSGGQKQRISLARAAYSDANILIMDDPLSAVDAHVGKHIFEKLIGPKGITKDKTRILVTHAIWVLPHVDEIYVLQNGSIVERGTYNQLLFQKGNFSQFLSQYVNTTTNEDEDEDENEEEVSEIYDTLQETSCEQPLLRQNSNKHNSTISIGSSRHRLDSEKVSDSTTTLNRRNSVISSIDPNNADEEQYTLVQEEKMETGKVQLQVYKFYGISIGIVRVVLPLLLFALAQASKAGGNIWLSKYSISTTTTAANNVTEEEEFDRAGFLTGYLSFGIVQCLSFFLASLAIWKGTLLAAKRIHIDLLQKVMHLPMSFFDTNPSGRIMNRMSKDIDVLDTILPLFTNNFLSGFTQVLVTMIVIINATPMVAIIIIPILGLYYIVQTVYIKSARQVKRIGSLTKSPIFSFFSESLQGVSTIRAFKRQKEFISVCQERIDEDAKAFIANVAMNRWLLVRLETLGNLITFASAIFAIASRGTIQSGIVGLAITYALEVTFIMNAMVRNASEIEANIVSVERIQEYIKETQEPPWTSEDKEKKPSKEWPHEGCIKFSNYQTRYRPNLELVLKGISCQIKSGEKVGIVGRTGAGKSSLTLGLFRIIEAAGGFIEIDGIDISKIGLHELRGCLTIIPQDPVIFSGNLRANLDPFDDYSDDEVWRAIENAHLKDYIVAQPDTLLTTIEEGGSNLSVGQRQLLCLARALLRKSKILVLDEATAAVDLDTDRLIQETIKKEFADCTILTIAHRLHNIMNSDRIIVLDKGQIAEFESPSQLLSRENSIFHGMAVDAGLA